MLSGKKTSECVFPCILACGIYGCTVCIEFETDRIYRGIFAFGFGYAPANMDMARIRPGAAFFYYGNTDVLNQDWGMENRVRSDGIRAGD